MNDLVYHMYEFHPLEEKVPQIKCNYCDDSFMYAFKKDINPICHGPLGPDRFMGGGQSARTFKTLSKSSFDHEILHLPPRCS